MTLYFNVPSDFPITKAEAYKRAKDRWTVQAEQMRTENIGICWDGGSGVTKYAKWGELPTATRDYI